MQKLSRKELDDLAWAATALNTVISAYFKKVMRPDILNRLPDNPRWNYQVSTKLLHVELEDLRVCGEYILIGWSITNVDNLDQNLTGEGEAYWKGELIDLIYEWQRGC